MVNSKDCAHEYRYITSGVEHGADPHIVQRMMKFYCVKCLEIRFVHEGPPRYSELFTSPTAAQIGRSEL